MQKAQNSNPQSVIVPDITSKLSKKAQVAEMFNNIAARYDFLNHFLSLGIDKGWRKKAINQLSAIAPQTILDVATGTGDLAIAAIQLNPKKIVGIDIASQMMDVGKTKVAALNLSNIIIFEKADSESIPYPTASFDAVMCAYGVRNFEHLEIGLKEMCRVLSHGGKVAILEFSHPTTFPIKQLYRFYFRYILPTLGKIVSNHSNAYTYLPQSVFAFPQGKEFTDLLSKSGFKNPKAIPLTFGITTLYTADK